MGEGAELGSDAQQARERGQSLQAFLLTVLNREAVFSRNRQLLAEITEELDGGVGAGPDIPTAAIFLASARMGDVGDGSSDATM